MDKTTQLKLAHNLAEAITTQLEEAECLPAGDPPPYQSISLDLVLSIENLCRQLIRSNERLLTPNSSPGYKTFVSSLSFRLFLLLSTQDFCVTDPVHLIPKLKQVIHATLLRDLSE